LVGKSPTNLKETLKKTPSIELFCSLFQDRERERKGGETSLVEDYPCLLQKEYLLQELALVCDLAIKEMKERFATRLNQALTEKNVLDAVTLLKEINYQKKVSVHVIKPTQVILSLKQKDQKESKNGKKEKREYLPSSIPGS